MVDRQNLPRPAPEPSEDGIPVTSEINEEVLLTGDLLEAGAAGSFADDEADVLEEMEAGPADRLSPEEAAMRVVDEPPGMNYDPDPGYVSGQEIG